MGNSSNNTSPHTWSSKPKMEEDRRRMLEMKIHQSYENRFGCRDNGEIVILFVARMKEN